MAELNYGERRAKERFDNLPDYYKQCRECGMKFEYSHDKYLIKIDEKADWSVPNNKATVCTACWNKNYGHR